MPDAAPPAQRTPRPLLIGLIVGMVATLAASLLTDVDENMTGVASGLLLTGWFATALRTERDRGARRFLVVGIVGAALMIVASVGDMLA